MNLISRLFIVASDGVHSRRAAYQVHLIKHDSRRDIVAFGDHQKPVEHPHMRFRFRGGEHDDYLIDIGGNNSFAAPATG